MPRILTKKSRHCGIGHVEGIWYNSVSIAYILAYYRFSLFFDKRANKTMIQETHMNKGATCTDREREREREKKTPHDCAPNPATEKCNTFFRQGESHCRSCPPTAHPKSQHRTGRKASTDTTFSGGEWVKKFKIRY